MALPDKSGYFGEFGGKFVPETLVGALAELEKAYGKIKNDKEFQQELNYYLRQYVGRPTPLYFAQRLSERLGFRVFLKREDLCHTGAHKINNTIGQALLTKLLGKKRVIAETGAGQHGVATATAAALFGLDCAVYMGAQDVTRQGLNVFRMKVLGTEVRPVESGSRTLKDAINEALRDWVTNVESTHYIIGSVVGPHPYPMIVRDFQSVIGDEARRQMIEQTKGLPDAVVACVGGGSNAMGIFSAFIGETELIGVEAAGEGLQSGKHGASLNKGSIGVLHGSKSYVLQDRFGQIQEAHSISAGLDYPGVGPEHAYLKDSGLATYASVTDEDALRGFQLLARTEGILCALETSHAIAYLELMRDKYAGKKVLVSLSGRGDKDATILEEHLGGTT